MSGRNETSWRAVGPNSDSALDHIRLPGEVTEAHVSGLVSAFDARIAANRSFAVVLELDDQIAMSAALRRTFARALVDRRAGLLARCRGIAIVARTPMAVGVHTAIRWLVDASSPERLFASGLDAETWARKQLGGS